MLLIDKQIHNAISSPCKEVGIGVIGFEPYDARLVNPSSLDFRLGDMYTFTEATHSFHNGPSIIDPLDSSSFKSTTRRLETYFLKPQESVLVSMYEKISLPDTISGRILGKSSLARLGLDNSSGAAWLDPGFKGVVTLELTNHHINNTIKLTHKMLIGQIIFYNHSPVGLNYKKTGRYWNQTAGQPSLGLRGII